VDIRIVAAINAPRLNIPKHICCRGWNVQIVVNLPDAAVKAVEDRANWVGTVKAHLEPDGDLFAPDALCLNFPRARAAEADAKTAADDRRRKAFSPSKSERLLIEAWNDSEFIREHAAGESRNNPIPSRDVAKHLPTIRRAIKELGITAILQAMHTYFKSCLKRDHLWDGRNHGYGHLGGFLRAITAEARGGQRPWWRKGHIGDDPPIADPSPSKTKGLADRYAKRLLGRDTFGLKNPSSDYAAFVNTAKRLIAWADNNEWQYDRACDTLLDAVVGSWGLGGCPPPGALSSERTWNVVFPAHLKALFG